MGAMIDDLAQGRVGIDARENGAPIQWALFAPSNQSANDWPLSPVAQTRTVVHTSDHNKCLVPRVPTHIQNLK